MGGQGGADLVRPNLQEFQGHQAVDTDSLSWTVMACEEEWAVMYNLYSQHWTSVRVALWVTRNARAFQEQVEGSSVPDTAKAHLQYVVQC